METIDPRGVAKFDPRCIVAYQTTKLWALWFQRILIFVIKMYMLPWQPKCKSDNRNNMQPFILSSNLIKIHLLALEILVFEKSMETIDPRGVAKFDSKDMNGTIYNMDY